jgi:uncharacterized protein YjdB
MTETIITPWREKAMSEAYMEYVEAEAGQEGEAWPGESEAAPGEAQEAQWGEAASRDRRLQMLRARQQAQRRRTPMVSQPRQAAPQRTPRPAGPGGGMVSDIQADVLSLDIDTKTALSRLRRDIDAADQLAYRNAWAAEAAAASALTLDTFGESLADHDWARALIIGFPTLLVAPRRKRKPGLEGIVTDPRVAGALGFAAIFGAGLLTRDSRQSKGVHSVKLSGPAELAAGSSVQLYAVAVDGKGNQLNLTVTYDTDQKDIATADANGKLTAAAGAAGTVMVTAAADGVNATPIWVNVS